MKALSSNQANQQALEEALLALIKGGDDSSVDDDIEGDSNSKLVEIEIPQTSLSFSNPSETRKVVKKKSERRIRWT